MSFDIDPERVFYMVSALLVWELCVLQFFFVFKNYLLKKAGLTARERVGVYSNRKNNHFSLAELNRKYGEHTLRKIDAIARKGVHVFLMLTTIVAILTLGISMVENFVIMVTYRAIVIIIFSYVLKKEKPKFLERLFFTQSPRIEDGKLARKNLAYARFTTFAQLFVLPFLLIWAHYSNLDYQTASIVVYMIYIPLSLGDAAAELIGAFFGKQKIEVSGIGEINRKSFAGTFAVFYVSFIGLSIAIYLNQAAASFYLLALVISLVSMLVEIKAPRGTDNFFIPVCNSIATVVCMEMFFL